MRSIAIRERLRAVAIAAIAATLILPLAAASDEVVGSDEVSVGEKTFEQEILDILRKDGKINEKQYRDLKAKAEAERAANAKAAAAAAEEAAETAAAAAAAAASTPAVSAGEENPKGFKVKYSNGLQIKRNDGNISLKLGGRIQADVASIWQNNALNASFPDGEGVGVEFRRARLYMEGDLYKRLIYKAQYDFAGDEVGFKDVYVGLKNLGWAGTIKGGNFKEPFSLEELTSSKYITFMERSLANVFSPGRDFGIQTQNTAFDQRMQWALGVFADSDSSGDEFFNDFNAGDWQFTSRVTGLPLYTDEGKNLVHLGLAYSYQIRGENAGRFRQRPETHLAERYVDTDDFTTRGNHLLGFEAAWVGGPFSVQAEGIGTWITNSNGTGEDAFLWGAYAYGSWFLTGEHRPYKTSSGAFARVKPIKSFNPTAGEWGAVELAVRYSYLDLVDKTILGGRQQDVTVGVNWYLFSNFRLMLNYVWADVKDSGQAGDITGTSGKANILQARASLEF